MQASKLILAIAILAAAATAQTYTNSPPVCFAFNATGTVASISSVGVESVVGQLTVHLAPPASAAVERIDIPGIAAYLGPCDFTLALYSTAFLGGPLVGSSLGSFAGGVFIYEQTPGLWPVWLAFTTPTAISLTGGATYALVGQLAASSYPPWPCSCFLVRFDTAGTQPLPYQLVSGSLCPPAVPGSGQLPFALRFRGVACGPGPLASVTMLGSPCVSNPVYLHTTVPPVLGAPWSVNVSGFPNDVAYLFWSAGVNPAGYPITGTSCQFHLDPVSLLALSAVGLEPLASATLLLPGPSGWNATFGFTMPAVPSLAGVVIGVQALIVTPGGMIPLGGGEFADITNAVALSLGY